MAEEILEKNQEAETLDEEKKNKLVAWIEGHPKTVFWMRLGLWILFAGILPFLFIAWRFELFGKVGQLQLSGFGLIGIIILAVVAITIIRYIKLAFKAKYSLLGQFLGGVCKIIIPLLALLAVLTSVRDNVDAMIKVLGVVTVCELTAIPLNPLPKWAYEMQKDVRAEERKETMDYLLDGFFKRKKDEGGGH